MSDGPVGARRPGSFGDEMLAEPTVAVVNSFQLALFKEGIRLGWLGKDGGDWAILVTEPEDAVTLETYPYNGVTYYRIKGTERYLSVSDSASAGFYAWSGASGFRRVEEARHTYLVSDDNLQKLSLYSPDDRFLYFWGTYSVLDIKVESNIKPAVVDPPLTSQIEHVVVLMLENRSFDNMLGGLYPELTREGLYRGLRGDEEIPLDPRIPSKGSALVFQETNREEAMIMPYPDPGELFEDMNRQIFGTGNEPTMSGFAWDYGEQKPAPRTPGGPPRRPQPKNIMQYYAPEMLPMTSFLARQYAVCDAWFASGPVQTLANRVFAHCGTPGRVPGTNLSRVDNPDFLNDLKLRSSFDFAPPVLDKTIFELLDDAYPGEINWKVYYHDAPLSALCSYVYQRWDRVSWDGGNVFHFKEGMSSETNLEYDIRNNQLPKYCFIEPRYTNTFGGRPNSNHPGGAGLDFEDLNGDSKPPPISVADGEALLHEIYTIFTKYPDTFAKTLLIVIYDEHGGLYDHVPPPKATSPFPEPVTNFSYDRYGVRVPALLINPQIDPGTIYPPRTGSEPLAFDHTSLISTLIGQFGLGASLTPRVASAPQLRNLISDGLPAPRPAPPQVAVEPEVSVDAAQAGATGNLNPLAGALRPLLHIERHARSVQRR